MNGNERCEFVNDVTFMIPPEPGTRRTEMPCLNRAEYFIREDGWANHALCKLHYEGKRYRGEDISEYRFEPQRTYLMR